MKQKYVLTAVAVVAVGAVALGTAPMWEGTNSVKQEETRTSIIEEPVNTETEVTGTPTPLPTTAPVTGISHTDSYEDLYAQVKEWQNNSSYSNVQPRIMTVEESADAAGTRLLQIPVWRQLCRKNQLTRNMALIHHQKVKIILRPPHRKN
jgi:inhibitor of cysteine peptidase